MERNISLTGEITIMPNRQTKKFWQTGADVIDPRTGQKTQMRSDVLSNFFSTHRFTPKWNPRSGQYETPGLNDEQLQEIVDSLDLQDSKTNAPITKANRYNKNDKFFNHIKLQPKMGDNAKFFNCNIPLQKVQASILFAYVGKFGKPGLIAASKSEVPNNSSCRWYIVDQKRDTNIELDKIKKKEEAFKAFTKLSKAKRKLYLISLVAMEQNPSLSIQEIGNQSDDFASAMLYREYIDNDRKDSNGVSTIERFIRLCSLSTDEIAIRALINKALLAGIIRKRGLAIYDKSDTKIAVSVDELVKRYLDPNYQAEKDNLELEINIVSK